MQEIGAVLPPLIGEVFTFLQRQGVPPAGAPFFRYLVVDMDKQLDMEVGWPIASTMSGNGRISAGVIPAGRYATLVHTGHPDELMGVTAALFAWGQQNGIVWQKSADGQTWGARLEFYLTDPAVEPDMRKWQTELAFLAADTHAENHLNSKG
jgi:effector-binding domain-containing protein